MKRNIQLLMFCLLAVPCAVVNVQAEDYKPCAEDIIKFCKKITAGGDGTVNCLKEHEQELSASCKDYLPFIQRKTRKVFPECQDDLARFCMEGQQLERYILIRCLKRHEAELSAECRKKLDSGE